MRVKKVFLFFFFFVFLAILWCSWSGNQSIKIILARFGYKERWELKYFGYLLPLKVQIWWFFFRNLATKKLKEPLNFRQFGGRGRKKKTELRGTIEEQIWKEPECARCEAAGGGGGDGETDQIIPLTVCLPRCSSSSSNQNSHHDPFLPPFSDNSGTSINLPESLDLAGRQI